MSLRIQVAACAVVFTLSTSGGAQELIIPGLASLQPARVRLGVDTIVVLITPRDSTERLSSVLIRSIARLDGPNGPMLRETQRYESHEPTRPGFSYDTLDVDARTLRTVRAFFSGGPARHDLHFSDLTFEGTATSPDSGTRPVHGTVKAPFIHGLMLEAFVAAFPFEDGAVLAFPAVSPPSADVHQMKLTVARRETIRTADGPVPCYLAQAGNGTVQYWISVADGQLMRIHWTLPSGASIWKIPQRDADLR